MNIAIRDRYRMCLERLSMRKFAQSQKLEKSRLFKFRRLFLRLFRRKKLKCHGRIRGCNDVNYLTLEDIPKKGPSEILSNESYLSTVDNIDSSAFKLLSGDNERSCCKSSQTDNHVACQKDEECKGVTCLYSVNSFDEIELSSENLLNVEAQFYDISSRIFDTNNLKGIDSRRFKSSLLFNKPNSSATVSSFEFDDLNSFWIYGTHLERNTSTKRKVQSNTVKLIEQIDVFGDVIRNVLINTTLNKISKTKEVRRKMTYDREEENNRLEEKCMSHYEIIQEKDVLNKFEKAIQVHNIGKRIKGTEINVIKKKYYFSDSSELSAETLFEKDDKSPEEILNPQKSQKVSIYYDRVLNKSDQKFGIRNWELFKRKFALEKTNILETLDSWEDQGEYDQEFHDKGLNRDLDILSKIMSNEIMNHFIRQILRDLLSKYKLLKKNGRTRTPYISFDKTSLILDNEGGDLFNLQSEEVSVWETQRFLKKRKKKSQKPSLIWELHETSARLSIENIRQSPLKIEITNQEITYNPALKQLEENSQLSLQCTGTINEKLDKCSLTESTELKNQLLKQNKGVQYSWEAERQKCLRNIEMSYKYPIYSKSDYQLDNLSSNPSQLILRSVVGKEEYSESKIQNDETSSKNISTYSTIFSRTDSVNLMERRIKSSLFDIIKSQKNIDYVITRDNNSPGDCSIVINKDIRDKEHKAPVWDHCDYKELSQTYINQLFNSDPESFSGIELSFTTDIDHSINQETGCCNAKLRQTYLFNSPFKYPPIN